MKFQRKQERENRGERERERIRYRWKSEIDMRFRRDLDEKTQGDRCEVLKGFRGKNLGRYMWGFERI